MKNQFSSSWVASSQVRKQRKYRYNAPLHIKQKFMSCHLSEALRNKYGMRNIGLKKGDSVKVARGQHKGKLGKVERVDLTKCKVFVFGVETVSKKGTKSLVPLEPSNLIIQELDLSDRLRKERIEKNMSKEK